MLDIPSASSMARPCGSPTPVRPTGSFLSRTLAGEALRVPDTRRQLTAPDSVAVRQAQRRLARHSLLFRPAAWASLPGLEQDVLRLNLLVVSEREGALRAHVPRTVRDGISDGGRVAWTVELVLFGAWLVGFGDRSSSLRGRGRGRRADPVDVLKVVAVTLVVMWRREEDTKCVRDQRPLTRSEFSRVWLDLFGEHRDRDWFKSRMTSAARYLAAYLAELQDGRGPIRRGQRLSSRQLGEVLLQL